MLVDLNYHSSPIVPTIPIIHWTTQHMSSLQLAYYTGIAPDENPLHYSLGNPNDYRSSYSGTPQVQYTSCIHC